MSQQPGWHPDPGGRHEYRYWDGTTWTDDVSDGGVTAKDPLPASTDPTLVGGGDPTVIGGHAASPTGPIGPSDPGGRSGPAPALVIGIVALVAVALAAGAFLLLRGDDDTDRSRLAAELSADADEPDPSGLGRFDDLEGLDVFEEFGGIGEEIGGGFGGAGGFDPDIAGSLSEIYQDALGLSRQQAECLAEAFTSTFEDLDEDDALNSFGAIFELFDQCGISMADLGGFDPDG
jgi:hypothetical protein